MNLQTFWQQKQEQPGWRVAAPENGHDPKLGISRQAAKIAKLFQYNPLRLRAETIFFGPAIAAMFAFNILLFHLYAQGRATMDGYLAITLTCLSALIISACVCLPDPARRYGLNLERLRDNLLAGFGFGGIGCAIAWMASLYLVGTGRYTFDFGIRLKDGLYPLSAVIQETAIKGFFQSYLMTLLGERRHGKILAIGIASLIFAQFHLIMGVPVFVLSFVFCFLTGWVYDRSRSVVGVSLIHYLTGIGGLVWLHW